MTTATLAATTPVDVLDNKKGFARVLDARDSARTMGDKVLAAPKAAREGLMSVLRALHVDAAAEAAFGLAKRAYGTVAGALARGWRFGTAIFGWKAPLLYALTDDDARGWIGKALGWTYLATCAAIYKTARVVSKVPFVGKPVVHVLSYPVLFVDKMVNLAFEHGSKLVNRYSDSLPVKIVHTWTAGVMLGRMIKAIVPARFRWIAWVAVMLRPTKNAYQSVRNDPAAEEIVEQVDRVVATGKAAAAAAQDVIVDRVLDGPRITPPQPKQTEVHSTQPAAETVDIIEVATGKRTTISVEVDSRGDKRVFWDGVYYDLPDLGQADTDPIRPLPIDPAVKAMRLDTERQAREAAAAAKVEAMAPASAATPAPEPTPEPAVSRPVGRALGTTGPRKAKAKAGRR